MIRHHRAYHSIIWLCELSYMYATWGDMPCIETDCAECTPALEENTLQNSVCRSVLSCCQPCFDCGHENAGLTDKAQRSKAERIAFDLIEYLDQIDYNKYFEAMGQAGTRGGDREKLYSDFSSQSIKAAQVSLNGAVSDCIHNVSSVRLAFVRWVDKLCLHTTLCYALQLLHSLMHKGPLELCMKADMTVLAASVH